MVKTLTKYLISGIFVFSAFTKLFDYQNTTVFLGELFGIGLFYSKIFLSLLVFVEMIIVYLLLFDFLKNKLAYIFIVALMVLFILANVLFAMSGKNNCGCFGTTIISSPFTSIVKNIIILISIYYLRNDFLNKIKLKTQKGCS